MAAAAAAALPAGPPEPRSGWPADLARIDAFLASRRPDTPCLVLDLAIVRQRLAALRAALPTADIYYAVKANPAVPLLAMLAGEGIGFELASRGEIGQCHRLGVTAERFCFGNTIKHEADIAWARGLGVSLFAFDSASELAKLARAAPGARVLCRIAVAGSGAEWPLSRKFGCPPKLAAALLVQAAALGLRPEGVSFHVGSQQTDPQRWASAIRHAAGVFRSCARAGLELSRLDLGGGLPAQYRSPLPPLSTYAEIITAALSEQFGGAWPRLMIEPGRYLVADAGLLRSRVMLVAPHGVGERRWVYLDAGRYNGLPETQAERIRYALRSSRDGEPVAPAILAGPTCDSTDVIYEHSDYALPVGLTAGDSVDFLSTGAYTASYAAVGFNGFTPLATYCV